MGFFSKPKFGDVKSYLQKGAIVLDVRTEAEYAAGHVAGSKLIVLDTLPERIEEIKALNKPIITCCRSGARSGRAEEFLKAHGIDVINGGPWENVDKHM
ncbi:rhodanese-like domain-containing protein [Flavobacteriaceae bacterium F08102]|nr:rhodanese-like domain-containing protein [Flavobacteriaceae bacterium F08102]